MHHLPPEPDLLRTELLIIVGIMRTRLGIYKEYEVAPVMVITTFAGNKSRILQAHYTEGGLVVLESDFFAFDSPEARREHVPLFLAYMSSEPVGDTRRLPALEE
ncbi:hypothetical protein BJX62DRAFT_241108 [Aspergillus germanicus]